MNFIIQCFSVVKPFPIVRPLNVNKSKIDIVIFHLFFHSFQILYYFCEKYQKYAKRAELCAYYIQCFFFFVFFYGAKT